MARISIYEGDTILLNVPEVNGFVYSLPRCSSFDRVTVCPRNEDTTRNRPVNSNVHYFAFKILPEYAVVGTDIDSSPLFVTKECDPNYPHRKLVYGRKIKLLHLASHKYLSLPSVTHANIENGQAAVVTDFNDMCLFKMLPTDKSRGDGIYNGDNVILESVQQKGYHVLCVQNAIFQSYELKPAVTSTEFCISLHSSRDIDVSSKFIRGGHVIRMCETEKNGYICGRGSTLTDVLPEELNHDVKTKVGARLKKKTLIPRPPPASGDSFWQIEKPDDPFDGTPFVYGEKCRLKHLLTEKYLAIKDGNEIVLVNSDREDCVYDFSLIFLSNPKTKVNVGSPVTTEHIIKLQDTANTGYIALNNSNWDRIAENKLSGSKWINLMLPHVMQQTCDSFKLEKVQPEILYQLYFVESIKSVLVKYMLKFIREDANPVMDELFDVLGKLLDILQTSSAVVQKTYTKMLRTTEVIDLLVGYLTIKPEKDLYRDLYRNVCDILKCYVDVSSYQSRKYLASDIFLGIFYQKIGRGFGITYVLSALLKVESTIHQTTKNFLLSKSLNKERINDAAIDFLSNFCFVNCHPARLHQNLICEQFIEEDKGTFYRVKEIHGVFYCYKTGSENELPMHKMHENERESSFFISQLKLFSSVCKGCNKNTIDIVKTWFPFSKALDIIDKPSNSSVSLKIKTAYLELIISVYLDPSIEDSGVDIDSMWHCYLWENLTADNCKKPLKGANVRKNVVNDLEYSAEITRLLKIIEQELEKNVLCVMDQEYNAYLSQVLSALEPMINFGYKWNIDDESNFDIESNLIYILNGETDVYKKNENDENKKRNFFKKERYDRTIENQKVFRIKFQVIKLLHLFFKQYIYLSLEQFLYDFAKRKINNIKSFPEEIIITMDFSPGTFPANDITQQVDDQPYLVLLPRCSEMKNFFSIKRYQCFNFDMNKKLVDILQDLMLYEDDNLKAASAALLYDIYNKEHVMFDDAKLSHIVNNKDDTFLYNEMLPSNSFDRHKQLKKLIHGAADDEVPGLLTLLEKLADSLLDYEDEIKTNSQNIAFTTGVFSAIMTYVLKFCSSEDESQLQMNLFRNSCLFLQNLCRYNPRIQEKIFEYCSDLLAANKLHISPVAGLLTEVVTNNVKLAQKFSEKEILQIYTLASHSSNSPEYLNLFILLQAIIKPFKSSTGCYIKVYQEMIAKLFYETDIDIYEQLIKSEENRIQILQECDDEDTELVKLIYLTNLLATCCEGQQKYAEEKCRQIFSHGKIVEILHNDDIKTERKVPFAYMLCEAYVNTEKESIMSLIDLSNNDLFWNHVKTVTQGLCALQKTIQNDSDKILKIKHFFKKIFRLYSGWKDICEIDDEIKEVCSTLYYFTKGIGPVLASFCCELSLYKDQKLAMREYENIVTSHCDTLKQLGDSLTALLTGENKKIFLFLSHIDPSHLWKNVLESIDKALPNLQIRTTIDYSALEDMVANKPIQSESQLNNRLQSFIISCEKIYDMNRIESNDDNLKDLMQLLPGGTSFMSLVDLFSKDIDIELDKKSIKGEPHYIAKIRCTLPLLDILNVLFDHLRNPLSSKNRAKFNKTLKQTLQILIGVMCIRICRTRRGSSNWKKEYIKQIKPIQDAVMEMIQAFSENVTHHITYLDEGVSLYVMAFLTTLFINGNEHAQNKFYIMLKETNDEVFDRPYNAIKNVIVSFGSSLKVLLLKSDSEQVMFERITGTSVPSSYTLPHEIKKKNVSFVKRKLLLSYHDDDDDEDEDEDDSNVVRHSPPQRQYSITTLGQLGASQEDLLYRVGFVLYLASAMCDGQNKKMQDLLRRQEHNISCYNIVGEIAVLLQSLAEVPLVTNIPTIIKAIQALIEICGGNFTNQLVAIDCQVIDSINDIMDHQHKSTRDGIKMQCKAIELLEILIEETDFRYFEIILAITKDLKVEYVVRFIEDIYENKIFDKPVTKEVEELTQSMFRAYHILKKLSNRSELPLEEFVGIGKHVERDKQKPWKFLNENSRSIEINYVSKNKEKIVTRVYFPFEQKRELNEDDKHQLQMNINRDGPEDKVRDLLEWTESVFKRDKYQTFLSKYRMLRLLQSGETMRRWILIFLTIVLNILVIAFFKIPQFNNCSGRENTSTFERLLILPIPFECWTNYQFSLLPIFGIPHLFFSVWMIIAFFVKEAPNISFSIPFIQRKLFYWKMNSTTFKKVCCRRCFDSIKEPKKHRCFDLKFYDPFLIYRIIFVICSLLGLVTFGYFYCFCILYIFINVDVFKYIVKAVTGKAKQLLLVVLLILALFVIYAVLSYAFMSSFFNIKSYQYCRTLWECLVTTIRNGIVGTKIPVNYVGETTPDFNIYLWRSFFDLIYYLVITIIALNVITAIILDAFSKQRANEEKIFKDQKDMCFICGISNDTFERKGEGFTQHYTYDHNMYNYIYYVLYIRSIPTKDHNAIEKYVHRMVEKKSIKFYPSYHAIVLHGANGYDSKSNNDYKEIEKS